VRAALHITTRHNAIQEIETVGKHRKMKRCHGDKQQRASSIEGVSGENTNLPDRTLAANPMQGRLAASSQ
jgi:hypothetical protein